MKYIWEQLNNKIIWLTCLSVSVMVFFIIMVGCDQLPQQADNPDNPLDPGNPDKVIDVPALVMSPVEIEVPSNGQFDLELWVLEASKVAGITSRITFDPANLQVNGVDSLLANDESFLLQNGGQLVWFSTIDNINGFIQIDCAVAEASPGEVEGTGIISRISFEHISGSDSQVNISNQSEFRDGDNTGIAPKALVGAKVAVK